MSTVEHVPDTRGPTGNSGESRGHPDKDENAPIRICTRSAAGFPELTRCTHPDINSK